MPKAGSKRGGDVERAAEPGELAELERHIMAETAVRKGARVFLRGKFIVVRLDKDVDPVTAAWIAVNMAVGVPEEMIELPTVSRDEESGEVVLTLDAEEAMIEL